MNKPALALLVAAAFMAGTSQAQQTNNTTSVTGPSIRDNPGLLGMGYADLGLSLERIRGEPDAAYTAGLAFNRPVARGVDVGLGYDYWWYDYTGANSLRQKSSYHLLAAEAKFYRPARGAKPFFSTLVGYQWSRGSYGGYVTIPPGGTTTVVTPPGGTSSIVTTPTGDSTGVVYPPGDTTGGATLPGSTSNPPSYLTASDTGHRPVWGLGGGIEVPIGAFAFTPHISYTDTLEARSDWAYHYGAELHHWFSEALGGYADVTFNDPRRLPASWSYFAGVRLRF